MCSVGLWSGLYEVEGGSLFPPSFFFFFFQAMTTSKAEGIRIMEVMGICEGNQGGLPLVPDVLARQHGREGPCDRGSVWEPTSNKARCEMSNHICFYSKQSGNYTAGSSGLLLKAFWGLLRDDPDGVIYPLFAERRRLSVMYMDMEFQSVIPHQGHLRVWRIYTAFATGWNGDAFRLQVILSFRFWVTLKLQALYFFIEQHSRSSLTRFEPRNLKQTWNKAIFACKNGVFLEGFQPRSGCRKTCKKPKKKILKDKLWALRLGPCLLRLNSEASF